MITALEGERRKLSAHSLLAARREQYILQGRRALLLTLLRQGTATADDVRAAVELPDEINPVCMGVVPGTLAVAGIIAADGFVKSTRAESHARPNRVWRLVDRAAAVAWLHMHPEPCFADPDAGECVATLFDRDGNKTSSPVAAGELA